MEFAVVNTKRSSLKIYSTTNASNKNYLGSIGYGETVEFSNQRIVNNIVWVKIRSNTIAGWAILKHPSVNYYSLEKLDSKATSNLVASSQTNSNNTASTTSNTSSKTNDNKDGKRRETTGVVTNLEGGFKKSTVEFEPGEIESIRDFKFKSNNKGFANGDPLQNLPQNVQNMKGYPFIKSFDTKLKRWEYDYSTDYSQNEFIKAVNDLRSSINLQEEASIPLYDRYSRYYNRFKVATPDDVLSRTFAHVFFTRPDCNILTYNNGIGVKLSDQVASNPDYQLEYKNNRNTLMQLTQSVGLDHEFMLLPSNRVTSFECKDRTIKTDTYGKTYHGNSIAYGRHIDDSTAASEVSISFTDDRNLHLFRMHQLWVQYISDVNKGLLRPFQTHLANRCLDYACSAYYIVCAENGEDIIYWSKLYGVFPTNIPDSIMTWSKGQYVTNPEINITYQYSFKKDWNASIIAEFNMMSGSNYTYLKTYDKNILSTGNTWVGAPFIEMVKDKAGRTVYKLRFRKE